MTAYFPEHWTATHNNQTTANPRCPPSLLTTLALCSPSLPGLPSLTHERRNLIGPLADPPDCAALAAAYTIAAPLVLCVRQRVLLRKGPTPGGAPPHSTREQTSILILHHDGPALQLGVAALTWLLPRGMQIVGFLGRQLCIRGPASWLARHRRSRIRSCRPLWRR